MKKFIKPFFVSMLIVMFMATAVFCCCVIKSAMASAQKATCSHCASTKQAPGANQCCFTKASPMEVAKNSLVPMPLFSLLVMAFVSLLYITPNPRLALRSLYINGPPGPLALVPLYIKSRSIRI